MTEDSVEPAAARAYRMLEGLIVTLELAPGSMATEGRIIERIGLGRTPVREAIQRLAWEGLIEIRPRAGLAIAPLNPSDWLKVIDARRGVEIVLARSAARRIRADGGQAFRDARSAMQQSVGAGDVAGFLRADKTLDEALAEAAENPFAARLAAPLQAHSRRFWYRYSGGGGLAVAGDLHMAVIDAVLARDETLAASATGDLMDLLRSRAEAAALA